MQPVPVLVLYTATTIAQPLIRNTFQFGFRFAMRLTVLIMAVASVFFTITITATVHAATAVTAPTAFNVQVTGKGTPIILIPGLASSGEVWNSTVKHFCGSNGKYECHVLTLAGFAGVAPIAAPLLATAAKEIMAYADAKKMVRPIVIGHSLGGFLALQLGISNADKFGRLIIIDSLPAFGAIQMPDITPEQLKNMASRMRDGMRSQDAKTFAEGQRRSVSGMVTAPEDLERVLAWGSKSDSNTVVNAMHDLIATDLRQDIALIKTPTLVLGSWYAYKDFAKRSDIENNFKLQYQKLNGVTIELADTAKHFIMLDEPAWMFARIEQFIK